MRHAVKISTRFAFTAFLLCALGWVFFSGFQAVRADVQRGPSVTPLDITRAPSTQELMAAGQLGGELYPTCPFKNATYMARVNLSFGKAIQAWNGHEYDLAAKLFQEHIAAFPDSPWTAEAELHVGCYAYYHGRYCDAEDAFSRIIGQNLGGSLPGQKALLSKARLRLGVLRVAQDRFEEAMDIFAELKAQGFDWRHRTYAAHWIQRLSRYNADRLALLDCGTKALQYVLEKRGKEDAARYLANIKPQTLDGITLEVLCDLAARSGLEMVAVRLPVGDVTKLPLPAIVFVGKEGKGENGHYWVLDRSEKERIELLDPQSKQRFNQTPDEFAGEWSGIALICADGEEAPGVRLSKTEMQQVFGTCCGHPRPPDHLGNPSPNAGPGGGFACPPNGSPTWSVNMINLNHNVADTPLWYSSPIGPPVNIALNYNSQSSITYLEPFGSKWQFNYASYLVVDPTGTVTIFMPDGRIDVFAPDGSGGYVQPFQVFNNLIKKGPHHYELHFPDGAVYTYNIPAGTSSMQPFLVGITDPHGQSLTFGYNSAVQLTTITDAMGRVTKLTYNAQGLVTQAKDPFGRTASFIYDSNRNLIQITDMGGYWAKLTYDEDIYITGIENSSGTWQFYTEPADGIFNNTNDYPSPGGAMWADYRITVTNPVGGTQEYHYDGHLIYSWYVSPRDYVPYVSSSINNFLSAPQTQYFFEIIGQGDAISSINYPGGGQVKFGYDANGNQTSITDADNNTTNLTYNNMGMVTSVMDPRGFVTQFTYAANGVDLLETTNGLGSVTRTYDSTHDVISVQERTGNQWKFTYDGYGHPQTATDPIGTATTFSYDPKHQLNKVTTGGLVTGTLSYDTMGRVSGRTDAAGSTTTYAYNNINNVTKISYSDGKYVAFTYADCCPNLIEQATDRAGRVTQYEHDAMKRLTKVIYPTGDSISYSYDQNGNLAGIVDTNGNSTSFSYDLNNRMIKKTYADGTSTGFSYDQAGLLTSRTNARGIVTVYGYDENYNLTTLSYSDATPGATFAYDDYNRPVQRNDAAGTYLFSYDKDSRLLSIDGPWGSDAVTYQYDALGRRSSLTVQGGPSLTYTYDALSRLTNIQNGAESYTYAYSGASPLVQKLTRPNGSKTVYQYDAVERLNLISHRNATGTLIRAYAYTFNGQDQRSSENKTDGNPVLSIQQGLTQYDYNTLNQLISSTNPTGIFIYDNDGNMIQGYTPDGYQFQAAYDAENRMQSIQYTGSGGAVFSNLYTYGADSAIAGVTSYKDGVLTGDTRYVREGFLPLQERDASGNVQRQYIWGPDMGGGIGGLLQLTLTQGGLEYSYLYDGRGNVSALLDSTQAVAAAYTYDGYGNITAQSGGFDQPYKFSTKAYDEGTGLSYYGYRFYSPATGRWITRDPAGEAQGANLYNFVNANPVNIFDQNGLATGQVGLSVNFQLGPVNLNDGIGFVIDGHGHVGFYASYGAGAGVGAGGGAGISFASSTGDTICDIAGPSANTSTSLGAGMSASVEGFSGHGTHGQVVAGSGFTLGWGGGASAAVGGSNTFVVPLM